MSLELCPRLRDVSTYLSRKEKQIGVAIAIAVGILYFALWFSPVFLHPHLKANKHALEYLAIGIVIDLVAIWGILRMRRLVAGALCMIVGFGPWGKYVFAAFPMLAFGAFSMMRQTREQKEKRQSDMAAKRAMRLENKGGARGGSTSPATGRSIPKESKRYTPPASKGRSKR